MKNKSKYLIVDSIYQKGAMKLGMLENVPDWNRMQVQGMRVKDFPKNACFRPSHNFPKSDKKMLDYLTNMNKFFVASEKLVTLLKNFKALRHNDVYPVIIFDHHGKKIDQNYFIVHQYDFQKCIDANKTKGKKSALNKEEYISVDKLSLDEKKVDPSLSIFRAVEYRYNPFIIRDIVGKIKEAEITGIEFFEVSEYSGF